MAGTYPDSQIPRAINFGSTIFALGRRRVSIRRGLRDMRPAPRPGGFEDAA